MEARHRIRLLTALAVAGVLLGGWLAYQPALSGAFLLDDLSNLGDLEHVHDADSALNFALSGDAGPLGRPLALATFALQAGDWEQGARPFLLINVAIHLVNGCLLFCFLYQLTRARGRSDVDARHAAVAAMAMWLFMPLLASSTLMVVQRMATLSAVFVLLGLNGYMLARASVGRVPNRALWGMSLSLVAATMLAMLSKESGALLPILVLVLESTLLSRPETVSVHKWRTWTAVLLALPATFILAYLAYRFPYGEALVLKRGFTGSERLMTEGRILWEYLFDAFVPRPGQYGPYHDGYPVARTLLSPLTFAAVGAWVVLVLLAVLKRRTHRLLAFAVLWFLVAHLLESTTIPLELYFEHRNYLAVIGPIYALCCITLDVRAARLTIARIALSLYILVSAFFLFTFSSLWGQPALAAGYWHEHYPNSVRAATALATHELANRGPEATVQALESFAAEHPDHAYIRVPALALSCLIAPDGDYANDVDSIAGDLRHVDFSYTAGTMLSDLLTIVGRQRCRQVAAADVRTLALALLENRRYRTDVRYRQFHHRLMASILRREGDANAALEHLYEARDLQASPELNMMVVTLLADEGRFDDANEFIEEAKQQAPLNPLKRIVWQTQLDELERYMEHMEGTSDQSEEANNDSQSGPR